MEKFYEIAGLRIRVVAADDQIYSDDGILAGFTASPGPWDHSLSLEICPSLSPPNGDCIHTSPAMRVYFDGENTQRYVGSVAADWSGAHLRISRRGSESHVQLKKNEYTDRFGPKTVLNSMEAEHLLTMREGFILHASVISHGGKAILFTAPSGTGKSTQAQLWQDKRGAEIINGDRAAVRIEENRPVVWGLPFAGSSSYRKNAVLPLAAVVYLSQAPENTITRLGGARAFRRIWEGCSVNAWSREDVELCSRTVMNVAGLVPVYHLACTPDESAVLTLEKALEQEEL